MVTPADCASAIGLTKKLERTVWNPSAANVAPGTTRRIDTAVVEIAEVGESPCIHGAQQQGSPAANVAAPTISPRSSVTMVASRLASGSSGTRRSRIAKVLAEPREDDGLIPEQHGQAREELACARPASRPATRKPGMATA